MCKPSTADDPRRRFAPASLPARHANRSCPYALEAVRVGDREGEREGERNREREKGRESGRGREKRRDKR